MAALTNGSARQLSLLSQSPVVLLIGSTGSGKSTLANFLLNPDRKHITIEQTFPTARSNRPQTQCVQCETDNRSNPTIQVIDTPGLNEGVFEDLAHMRDIVRTLRGLHYVSACILCVRFNAKIDIQWKATVTYYKNLLPQLFEGNVVIVMTDYQTDERSTLLREMQGIDVDEVTRNVLAEVVDSGVKGLTYRPQVFRIDCLPVDGGDYERSEQDREAILSYIRERLSPVRVSDLKVMKTDALKHKDLEEISRLDGEISGYKRRLVEIKTNAGHVLDEIESMENQISLANQAIQSRKAELAEKDKTEPVIAEVWSVEEKWKLFRWQSKDFAPESRWPVSGYSTWDNGHLKWKVLNVTRWGATGRVEGKFMRGLYANLTLMTRKCDKYADVIRELRTSIATSEAEVIQMKLRRDAVVREEKEHNEEVDLLMAYIAEKSGRKKVLSQDYLTVEQVEYRLGELSRLRLYTRNYGDKRY